MNTIEVGARFSVIAGGAYNLIKPNAEFAMLLGGYSNIVAEPYALSAGRGAQALHGGSFIWADASVFNDGPSVLVMPFPSTATNEFAARATGGVRFVSGVDSNGAPAAGVSLSPGSGTWSTLSDRDAKENFAAANGREILEKLAGLPLATWNYKTQDKSIRHLGVTAQDFHAAFGLGESDRAITTIDADGVALGAIQGLNQKLEQRLREKDAELQALQKRLGALEKLLETLANRGQ